MKGGGKSSVVLFVVFLCFCARSRAQNWSGILDPSRAIDWSHAGAQGGVQARTTICSSIPPYNGAADKINRALTSCPPGQVVFLQPGTFNLSSGIKTAGHNNVTLRGAGPDKTFLVFNPSSACLIGAASICLIDSAYGLYPPAPGHTANWTAGYSAGTNSIVLDGVTGLAKGDLIVLDQCNDGLTSTNCSGTEVDTENVWVCSAQNKCSSEGDSGVRRGNRSQSQVVVVTSISRKGPYTVGITPGLYARNWRSSQSPGAWWSAAHSSSGVGVEDLSMDHQNCNCFSGVFVSGVRDWWVRNVRSIYSARAAIWSYGSTRGTIRDSYFFGTQNSASLSYGLETDISSDILVENNIFQAVAMPMPTGESVTGSVYGYNYAVNDFYVSGGNVNWMQASQYHHSGGTSMHLFEGNIGPGFTADMVHGTSVFATMFRNRWLGQDATSDGLHHLKTQQTDPVQVYAFNRYFNIIGNVLGLDGFHTYYEYYPRSGSDPGNGPPVGLSIYMIGWSGNSQKHPTINNDLLVRNTMMRWGNYDTVNNAVRFVNSEVPSGIGPYGNAVPASKTLPASFYLNSQPVWWTNGKPWPPIGPDVSGGNLGHCSAGTMANFNCTSSSQCTGGGSCVTAAGGHVNSIPAEDCYLNVMGGPADGSGPVLPFNANSCYGNAQPPAPSTSRNGAVQ